VPPLGASGSSGPTGSSAAGQIDGAINGTQQHRRHHHPASGLPSAAPAAQIAP
jgi:hypothetical protein